MLTASEESVEVGAALANVDVAWTVGSRVGGVFVPAGRGARVAEVPDSEVEELCNEVVSEDMTGLLPVEGRDRPPVGMRVASDNIEEIGRLCKHNFRAFQRL